MVTTNSPHRKPHHMLASHSILCFTEILLAISICFYHWIKSCNSVRATWCIVSLLKWRQKEYRIIYNRLGCSFVLATAAQCSRNSSGLRGHNIIFSGTMMCEKKHISVHECGVAVFPVMLNDGKSITDAFVLSAAVQWDVRGRCACVPEDSLLHSWPRACGPTALSLVAVQ